MNLEKARFNMVEQQILPTKVVDPEVVGALFAVKRENFVPSALRHLAMVDVELPLGNEEVMLCPKLEARMLNALGLQPSDKVLEVGTGSGYTAALLGTMAAQVSSVERQPEFVGRARENLRAAAIANVRVLEGDGLLGLPGDAPFDAILVSGALKEVPRLLLDQLKVDGRLVVVVGSAPAMQVQRITRCSANDWQTEVLFETVAPYLRAAAVSSFKF